MEVSKGKKATVHAGRDTPVDSPPLKAGELCGVLLLLMMPTTLNTALVRFKTNGHDLSGALDDTLQRLPDPGAEKTYRKLIQKYKPLLDQLLADPKTVDAARQIQATILTLNVGGSKPWQSPPHPGGADVARLMDAIQGFDESISNRG